MSGELEYITTTGECQLETGIQISALDFVREKVQCQKSEKFLEAGFFVFALTRIKTVGHMLGCVCIRVFDPSLYLLVYFKKKEE